MGPGSESSVSENVLMSSSLPLPQREDPTGPPLDSRRAYSVAHTLEELAGFLLDTPNARDTKDKQKLLRNLRVRSASQFDFAMLSRVLSLFCMQLPAFSLSFTFPP